MWRHSPMKNSPFSAGISRRRFLAATSLAVAAPTIIPASVFGAGKTAPSERITMGVVGWGMMGPGNTDAFLGQRDCQIVAACDLDKNHLQGALDKINGHYQNQDCKAYHDYREMMARTDIDAVMLAVPDHWHALMATEAAKQQERHLRRKTSRPHDRRAAGDCQSRPEEQAHLADRFLAAFPGALSQSRRDRAQRPDRQSHPRRSRPALRPHGFRPHGRQDECHRAPGVFRLRFLDRPFANGTLHRRPRAHELALELQHRRRPVARLDRPPLRHRSLGSGLR